MRTRHLAAACVAIGLLAGCGGDDDSEPAAPTASPRAPESASDVVHTFDGRELTCEEVLDITLEDGCDDSIVDVWERWGDNLDDYVTSGQLGPLNDESYRAADVAFAGIMACVITTENGDEQDFIDVMRDPRNRTGFEDLSGTELLPAWFAASEDLCPAEGMGEGTDAYIIE